MDISAVNEARAVARREALADSGCDAIAGRCARWRGGELASRGARGGKFFGCAVPVQDDALGEGPRLFGKETFAADQRCCAQLCALTRAGAKRDRNGVAIDMKPSIPNQAFQGVSQQGQIVLPAQVFTQQFELLDHGFQAGCPRTTEKTGLVKVRLHRLAPSVKSAGIFFVNRFGQRPAAPRVAFPKIDHQALAVFVRRPVPQVGPRRAQMTRKRLERNRRCGALPAREGVIEVAPLGRRQQSTLAVTQAGERIVQDMGVPGVRERPRGFAQPEIFATKRASIARARQTKECADLLAALAPRMHPFLLAQASVDQSGDPGVEFSPRHAKQFGRQGQRGVEVNGHGIC